MTAPRHNIDAGGLTTPEGILLERMGLDRVLARSSLATFKVRVISLVSLELRPLFRALRSWGMQTVKQDEHLALVLVDSYLNPELESVIHRLGPVDILVVQPVGITYYIGPLLRPGARCWPCIKQGLQYHQPLLTFIQNHTSYEGPISPPLAFHPGTLNLCWYRVCLDLVLYVLQDTHPLLEGHIISTDLASGQQSKHSLDHVALCPACRQRKRSGEQGFSPILIDQDEENREASTAGLQTMHARIRSLMSPMTGIISAWIPIPTAYARRAFHIIAARQPFLRDIKTLADVHFSNQKYSSAYGRSRLEAEVRSGCEAVEHYSTVLQGYEDGVRKPYDALRSVAYHPDALLLFSERQYAERDALNAQASNGATYVPFPLSEEIPIYWSPVWSVTKNEKRWVPRSYCYYGATHDDRIYALADSNGTAVGSSITSAVKHGLYELIERDAVAIWHYNRLQKRAVDVASWDNAYVEQLRGVHHALDRDLFLIDVSSDLPLYVMVATSVDRKTGALLHGFGAGATPEAAIRSAVEECCQMLANVVSGDAFDVDSANPTAGDHRAVSERNAARYAVCAPSDRYLFPDPSLPSLKKEDYPDGPRCGSLHGLLQKLEEKDIDVLVLDLTRAETGPIPAVRVIAPGLRSWYPRYGPGRLYTVPVLMGDHTTPNTEEAMHPRPITE